MSKQVYSFHKLTHVVFTIGPLVLLTLAMIAGGLALEEPLLVLIGVAGLVLWSYLINQALGRRIVMSGDGIYFITWRKQYYIAWNDVECFGGFRQSQYFAGQLSEDQLNRPSWPEPHLLYVSRLARPKVASWNISNDFICLQYRKGALESLHSHLGDRLRFRGGSI